MKADVVQFAKRGLAALSLDPYPLMEKAWGRYLRWKAAPARGRFREDGVSLFFDVNGSNSLSKVGRDFARKLSMASIPFAAVDSARPWGSTARIPPRDREAFSPLVSRKAPFRKAVALRCPEDRRTGGYDWYADVFYEFGEGLLDLRPRLFEEAPGVCVFSTFCEDLVRAAAPDGFPVYRFRYPFVFPAEGELAPRPIVRARHGVPDGVFAAFFNFDYRSSMERKNPRAGVVAFAKAFGGREDAFLVFKTSGAETCPGDRAELARFAAARGLGERTIFIDGYLTEREVIDLTAAMDVYLSLHRGEGLGLGMLEAMAVKVPVVASAYGGNMEFTTERTAFPVPCEVVRCRPRTPAMAHARQWAEPDVEAAAALLRQIRDRPSVARERAAKGLDFIRDYYSLENFVKSVYGFLEAPGSRAR